MALPHPSKTFTTLVSLLLLHLFLHFSPATADSLYQLCGTTGSFTGNSTYQTNLNYLLSSLSSNSSLSAGFSAGTYGQVPDKIYGLSLCRGDTNSSACLSCLTNASQDILQLCAYNKDATIWYDLCQLRYSNTQFLTSPNIDSNNQYYLGNTNNITNDRSKFDQSIKGLIANISNWAAYNSSKSFATAEMNFTST